MKLTKLKLLQIIKEELTQTDIGAAGGFGEFEPRAQTQGREMANVITSFIEAVKAIMEGDTFYFPVNLKIGTALENVADADGYLFGSSTGLEEQRLNEGFLDVDPKILLGIGILIGVLLIVAMVLGYTVKIDCESSSEKGGGVKKKQRGCKVHFIGPEGKESAQEEPAPEVEEEPWKTHPPGYPGLQVAEGRKRSKRLAIRRKRK